ncbi:hypothetical protein [Smaragdicoccus niigatensis]|uniref:hypothetical protein n=1 Tax=Smaragdicoccus niigatensis TaxID=359359 RepID=UPI00035DAD7F|nr:hypothetical protein [Smaragdicoccus niigatensis]
MNTIFTGVRPLDYVIAVLFVLAGAGLMLVNMNASPADMGDLASPIESQSWLLVPTFALAMVPILWRRANQAAAIGGAVALIGVHDLMFGSVIRCGVGLPLSLFLAYAVARFAPKAHLLPLLIGVAVVQVVVFVDDSAAGLEAMPFALGLGAVAFGIGLLVRAISAKMARRESARTLEPAYV